MELRTNRFPERHRWPVATWGPPRCHAGMWPVPWRPPGKANPGAASWGKLTLIAVDRHCWLNYTCWLDRVPTPTVRSSARWFSIIARRAGRGRAQENTIEFRFRCSSSAREFSTTLWSIFERAMNCFMAYNIEIDLKYDYHTTADWH